ncbi:MBL fold metallo-hydrolase [Desulfosediminicola flagellatus]|uniref:MBL fold metallo-hydrolase n=1 Tax=Desulfosediminicola flagellatus TaxID=2569541 RepID=UPI0010ACCDF4|nr:MBL fold metallo-hydrolase [Desulfosediminicola flagellatus]
MNELSRSFGVHVIDTGYLRENFAASHMIVENGKAAFVDVGTSNSSKYLVQAVHAAGLKNEDVLYIILTHIHLDHAGGAGQLMELFPNSRLVVHPKGARHIISPEKLIAGAKAVYGEVKFSALYGDIIGVNAERVIEANDGFVLDFEGRELHFIDTPGHARHHCCIWDPKSGGVFTGDTLGLAYPELQRAGKRPFLVCTTSPSAFEPDEMISSIDRIMSLRPSTLYLTHFGPIKVNVESIRVLKNMVLTHKEVGLQAGADHAALSQAIDRLFVEAFSDYLDGHETDVDARALLAGDVEMNTQGVMVWIKRQEES